MSCSGRWRREEALAERAEGNEADPQFLGRGQDRPFRFPPQIANTRSGGSARKLRIGRPETLKTAHSFNPQSVAVWPLFGNKKVRAGERRTIAEPLRAAFGRRNPRAPGGELCRRLGQAKSHPEATPQLRSTL